MHTEIPQAAAVGNVEAIEMNPNNNDEVDGVRSVSEAEQTDLPPTDGGKAALLLLCGCFMAEAMCWALPFSYGVFQDYYTHTPPFSLHADGIAVVGTCVLSILYIGGTLVYAAINRFGQLQNYFCFIGICVMSLSLVLASFATTVWQLILTQGIMFGIGGCLLLYTAIHFLDGYFVKRKGFAFGVLCTGNGVAGATVPFILNWSLNRYSYRTTLRSWAIIIPLLTLPFLPFLKPRVPLARSRQTRRISYAFTLTPTFWLYQVANILEGLGYFMPTIYLSTYAQQLGYSQSTGSLLIALVNIAAVFSQLSLGYLVDRIEVSTVMLISALGSSVAALAIWGTATSLPLLIIFAITYGAFAGGWTSTWIGMTKETTASATGSDHGTVFGLFCVGRGIGAVVSGPLSEALLGRARSGFVSGGKNLGYGTGYGALIVFTGASALCGTLSFIARRINIVRHIDR